MAQLIINTGAAANDGTGDPLRTAFTETNTNFTAIFTAGPVDSNVRITDNTILTLNTNGNLVLAPNGVGKVVSNVDIVPNSANIRSLGSSSNRWNTVYTQYLNATETTILSGDVTVGGNLTVTGDSIELGNIITDALTIQLGNTASTDLLANGAGVTVGSNDDIATILYNASGDVWTTNIGISASGNITASNFITVGSNVDAGNVNASGNITGSYFIGDGSQLTGVVSSYGDANVATYLDGSVGNIIPSGNAIYSLGNASNQWKELHVSNTTIYIGGVALGVTGNTLTVAGEPVLSNDSDSSIGTTGNISASNILATGNMDANNLVVTNIAEISDISIAGGYITLVDGSASTGIDISPNGEGQAFIQVPDNATANTANLRVVNNAGNVTVETNPGTIWTFGYDGNLTAPGNVSANAILTDNYFYANGAPFVNDSIGNLEVTGTTIGIAAGASENTITVGNASAGLEVTPDSELPVAKLYAYSADQQYFAQGDGDYSSGTYTTGPAGGRITLSGATIVQDYLNALQGQVVSVTVNDTETVEISSYGYGGGTVTIDVTAPPGVDPTTVSDILFNTQFENRIVFDIDAGDYGIYVGNDNFEIQTGRDIRLSANDDLSITSLDGFDLRSRSPAGGVSIIADGDNTSQTWQFQYDGNLILPNNTFAVKYANGTTVSLAGDYTDSNVVSLMSAFGSNTVTTTGNIASGNLIVTDTVYGVDLSFTGTANLATVNATGNITAGNILTDNYFYANGTPFTPGSDYGDSNVVTLLSSFGSNNISTTGNITAANFEGSISITGNVTGTSANVDLVAGSYTWSFDNAGNLVLPGNTFAVNYANGTAVQLGGAGDYGDSNVVSLLSSFGSNTITTTGNVTVGNILTDNYRYANGDPFTAGTTYSAGTGIDIASNVISVDANVVLTSGSQTIATTGDITANVITANIANISGNVTAGNVLLSGNITGSAANVTITANSFVTTFDTTGTVTFPGAMQLAVYANTTVRDTAISSPTPGMMIYVADTGMQVRGATQWNTISGSGT